MTANATHPGRVTIPGTDIGVAGTLVAEPQTENMLLGLDDRLTVGGVKVDTDPDGNLYAPGLVVPIVSGLLWELRFEPYRTDLAPFSLGVYNLNTSGTPLEDLVAVVPVAVDETMVADILAAAASADADAAAAAASAAAASAAVGREVTSGVMGIGADGKIADGKRISTALGGLNILNYGTVTAGGNILQAWNAAGLAASKTAAIAPPRVYVPYCAAGYTFASNPTIYDGVTYEGLGYVTLRNDNSGTGVRGQILNLAGKTDVTLRGFTFDLLGNVSTCGVNQDSTSTDNLIDDCRFVNSTTVSYAVTNKELTGGNTAVLTIGTHTITNGSKIQIHGVNGTTAADAAAFNSGSSTLAGLDPTVSAVTGTTVSYPVTHANVTSVASSGGWVTVGSTTSGVYAINCDASVRPRIERCLFNGTRAGVRIYQGVTGYKVNDNTFRGWGDRCIFVNGTATGHSSNGKIMRNTIEPPSQKFGEPHQPIAMQGVATYWHSGVEIGHNIIDGAVSGGNLVAHHTGKSNNDLLGGIADAISVHHSRLVNVHHNQITNAGEVGITVANDAWLVNVEDNLIDGSNANPIALDWSGTGGAASFVKSIKVQNNVLRNGGQERGQAVTGDAARVGAGGAVWLSGTTNCTVGGNHAEDDQGVATMTALTYIKDTTASLVVNENMLFGGTTKQNVDASIITAGGVKFNHAPVTTVLASDTAGKNDTTAANLPAALTRTLERGAEYEFELVVPYTTVVAGATPGIVIGFAAIASGTLTGYAEASGTTATGGATVSNNSNRAWLSAVGSTVVSAGHTGSPRLIIRGRVKNGGTAVATFQPTYAQQNTDAVNATTVKAGAWLTTRRVA